MSSSKSGRRRITLTERGDNYFTRPRYLRSRRRRINVVGMDSKEAGAMRWKGHTAEQIATEMKRIASKPRPNAKGRKKPRKPPRQAPA